MLSDQFGCRLVPCNHMIDVLASFAFTSTNIWLNIINSSWHSTQYHASDVTGQRLKGLAAQRDTVPASGTL